MADKRGKNSRKPRKLSKVETGNLTETLSRILLRYHQGQTKNQTFIFVVKDWIIVISGELKVIVCFPISVLRENIIHLTVKFSFRYCDV